MIHKALFASILIISQCIHAGAAQLAVSPKSAVLTSGQTQQFSASAPGSNPQLTWAVNGVQGGNATVGTVSVSGLYTAPSSIPSKNTLTITASTMGKPSAAGNATVTLSPVTVSVTPGIAALAAGATQQFTAIPSGGSNVITWSLSPQVGSISAAGIYTAPASVTTTQTVSVIATQTGGVSGFATVTVKPSISVAISPTSVVLGQSQSQQFTASVAGTTNTTVSWSVSPLVGTITSAGLYTAPASITAQQTVTITAVSAADSSNSAAASVTMAPSVGITTGTLPNGKIGVPYSGALSATGGVPPYSWSVVSGTPPPGLSLASALGTISGTPTAAGSYPVTLQASDALGNKASQSYVTTIAASSGVTWAPTYYVSAQTGNDNWSGLLDTPNSSNTDGPFKSIGKAQAAMRASSTVKATTLRTGTYSIATPLTLNWTDSGELWIAYPGETPILDGGGAGYVSGAGASNITIEGLTLQNLGDGGSGSLYLDSTGHKIRWNTILNCPHNCITGQMSNSMIDSNTINGVGGGGWHGAIALWYGASNNKITHNLIKNSAEEGVNISTGSNDPAANNNLVDRNVITNACSNTVDCGALYMYDASHRATGNQITNNVINGVGGTNYLTDQTKAIYLDNSMSNVTVTGNICRNCGEWAFEIIGGDHNTVVNNIFDLSGGAVLGLYQCGGLDFGMTGNVFKNNIVYFASTSPANLWQVNLHAGDSTPTDTTNLYYSASNAQIANNGVVDVSPFYTNPQFTNATAGDYSMPSTSPAYSLIGFLPLPTDQGPLPYAP